MDQSQPYITPVAPLMDELARELEAKLRGEVRRNKPMSMHTTFRVGGPADLYIGPQDQEDLLTALGVLHQAEVSVYVIGNGSNMLVSDSGIRGAVIRLTPHFAQIDRQGDTINVGAGAKLARVIRYAATEELSGLESTMGIPGTIGGALVMNAGTDFGSISDIVESATCVTMDGHTVEKSGEALLYKYRESAFQDHGQIVTSARLRLTPGDREDILAKMKRLEEKRTSRQPVRCRTAGCTFKNIYLPEGRLAAGKLIDQAGGKGHRIGGAEVSPVHANFIVAHPGATASDVRNLANWMHRLVREVHGHNLEMEIEIVGDWSGWSPDEEP